MRFLCVAVLIAVCASGVRGEIELKTVEEWGEAPLEYLWDAYEKNVIYALYTPHYGEGFTVSIHFMEDLIVPTHNDIRYAHDRRIDADAFTYRREGERLIYEITQEDPIRYELHFEVFTHGDTIMIAGTIHNREDALDWDGVGLICVRLRECADFFDYDGERTYLTNRAAGERVSVFDACGTDTPLFYLPTSDEHSEYLPVVEKEDRLHRCRVRHMTQPANNVGGNRKQLMSCIHCDLKLDVPAGESLAFHSEVRLMEIEPNAARLWTMYE